MKILLAIDVSTFSETVVGEVATRPCPSDSSVCALKVVDLFTIRSAPANGRLIDAQVRDAESMDMASAAYLVKDMVNAVEITASTNRK